MEHWSTRLSFLLSSRKQEAGSVGRTACCGPDRRATVLPGGRCLIPAVPGAVVGRSCVPGGICVGSVAIVNRKIELWSRHWERAIDAPGGARSGDQRMARHGRATKNGQRPGGATVLSVRRSSRRRRSPRRRPPAGLQEHVGVTGGVPPREPRRQIPPSSWVRAT